MKVPEGYAIRLAPEDEYCHTPDDAPNYNESMYFNMLDPAARAGGWFRLGNRPNEGHAEMTCCLYLPDGRVGFMYARPEIAGNDALDAGGMRFDVIEPFKRLRVRYSGKLCVLANPHEMADPSKAFRSNPIVDCEVDLDYEGVSPMFGGETVKADGSPLPVAPEKSFAKAHYEQHMAARGHFRVGTELFEVAGYGLRDKSWGPRYWQAIHWYRWLPMNFGRDFAMMISIVTNAQGASRIGGMVLKDGAYDLITDAALDTVWDGNWYQKALTARVETESGARCEVAGRVLSLIPLRNRRTTPAGETLLTRITEGMTEYTCNGMTGYGLSEYLDQIVDGRPVGVAP